MEQTSQDYLSLVLMSNVTLLSSFYFELFCDLMFGDFCDLGEPEYYDFLDGDFGEENLFGDFLEDGDWIGDISRSFIDDSRWLPFTSTPSRFLFGKSNFLLDRFFVMMAIFTLVWTAANFS